MVIPRINLASLAYVHYRHQDLGKEERFLNDFGLVEQYRTEQRVYYRGTGPQPFVYIAEKVDGSGDSQRFIAAAWEVQSMDDLTVASQLLDASPVETSTHPGGGSMVTLQDPNGFEMRLHYGQKKGEESSSPLTGFNLPYSKPRKGQPIRVRARPSRVHKLGHYGFMVPPSVFKDTLQWYTSTFNLKITDSVFDPATGEDKTCFIHIDKGDIFTDHHSFFLGYSDQTQAQYTTQASRFRTSTTSYLDTTG